MADATLHKARLKIEEIFDTFLNLVKRKEYLRKSKTYSLIKIFQISSAFGEAIQADSRPAKNMKASENPSYLSKAERLYAVNIRILLGDSKQTLFVNLQPGRGMQ